MEKQNMKKWQKVLLAAGVVAGLGVATAQAGVWDGVKTLWDKDTHTASAPAAQPNTNAEALATPAVDTAATSAAFEKTDLNVELVVSDDEYTMGNPNAPVQIVEYMSMTCSHCADFGTKVFPTLKEKLIDTGKVYFVVRQMPWDPAALVVAKVLACAPRDSYFDNMKTFLRTQRDWTSGDDILGNIRKMARMMGVDDTSFDACVQNPALHQTLINRMQVGQNELNVRATPTFFVNNTRVEGAVPYTTLERAVAEQQ